MVPHSCGQPQTFSDGVAWFLLVLVGLLFFILSLLVWPKVKKYVFKDKTPVPPTTTGKGVCFQKKTFCISIKFS